MYYVFYVGPVAGCSGGGDTKAALLLYSRYESPDEAVKSAEKLRKRIEGRGVFIFQEMSID